MQFNDGDPFSLTVSSANHDTISKALTEANRQNTILRSVLRTIAEMSEDDASAAPRLARDILART